MDIGNAIKILRIQRGYSQKDFATKCVLSVNTLGLIERNETFPQKTTIKKICENLEVPVSYLLFFSIEEKDIPANKLDAYKAVNPLMKSVLLDEVGTSFNTVD